jgi:nucleotide-binding universal stress UspA family protein
MLHPSQFTVNDAWIGFRLNDAAIVTGRDGDFDCLALMDAASCCIVGMEMYSARATGPSEQESRRLLQQGQDRAGTWPSKLFVEEGQIPDALCQEAARLNIEVVMVPEGDLLVFIGDARDGFKERFGRTQ